MLLPKKSTKSSFPLETRVFRFNHGPGVVIGRSFNTVYTRPDMPLHQRRALVKEAEERGETPDSYTVAFDGGLTASISAPYLEAETT